MQYINCSWTLLILCSTCTRSLELNVVALIGNNPKYGRNDDLEFDFVSNGFNHPRIRETKYQDFRQLREHDHGLEINGHDDRFKRTQPTVLDSGYWSRLSAAAKLARDRALQIHVYGNRGPGKRSTVLLHERMIALPLRVLIKRDFGYGTGIRTGYKTVYPYYPFGVYEPGRTGITGMFVF